MQTISLQMHCHQSPKPHREKYALTTCAKLGGAVRSVLDRSEREDVRLISRVKQTLPLLVYKGTWTHSPPLVAMRILDRSGVSVGIFLKLHATFPNSGIRARSMGRWYAWVEHKELWAVIVILLTTNVLFWFGGIVGEAARTNLTCPCTWDRFHWQTCN